MSIKLHSITTTRRPETKNTQQAEKAAVLLYTSFSSVPSKPCVSLFTTLLVTASKKIFLFKSYSIVFSLRQEKMTKFVFFLVCLAIAVHIGNALNCYTCNGDQCNDKSKWQNMECGKISTSTGGVACLKSTYTDRASKKEVTARKCVYTKREGNKNTFQCIEKDGPFSACEICESDLCNSATSVSTFASFTVIAVAASYLLPKMLLH